MVRVKICGLTRPDDALHAAACGADALGFIAVRESPRYLDPEAFRTLNALLPPFVTTVCVARTRDEAAPYPTAIAQIYEDGDGRVIRAFRIRDRESLETALAAARGAIQLDAFHESALGGTGHTFDWSLAAEAVGRYPGPVILAGGLTPENVADAVRQVRPYAVDVSSGVEMAPGCKDPDKVARFVAAAKGALR